MQTLHAQREVGAFVPLSNLQRQVTAWRKDKLAAAPAEFLATVADPAYAHYIPDRERDSDFALLRQTEVPPELRSMYEELKERYNLERFAAQLRLLSCERPQCILIEDAQWLDDATLRAIAHAMRFLAGSRGQGFSCRVAWLINHRSKDEEGDTLETLDEHLRSVARLEQEPR